MQSGRIDHGVQVDLPRQLSSDITAQRVSNAKIDKTRCQIDTLKSMLTGIWNNRKMELSCTPAYGAARLVLSTLHVFFSPCLHHSEHVISIIHNFSCQHEHSILPVFNIFLLILRSHLHSFLNKRIQVNCSYFLFQYFSSSLAIYISYPDSCHTKVILLQIRSSDILTTMSLF